MKVKDLVFKYGEDIIKDLQALNGNELRTLRRKLTIRSKETDANKWKEANPQIVGIVKKLAQHLQERLYLQTDILETKSRARDIILAKHILRAFCHIELSLTYRECGYLEKGCNDHSTIVHSVNTFQDLRVINYKVYNTTISKIYEDLKNLL